MTCVGRRADLGASWTEIVETWFLGQRTAIHEEEGWSALETLERLAPEKIYELEQLPARFPLLMTRAIRLGADLACCERSAGFERVVHRVRIGERSAISEVMWGALLVRAGYAIELDPVVGTRRVDTLIHVDGEKVFAEVMAPGMSKETTEKLSAMQALAGGLRASTRRVRLEVHLSEDPRGFDLGDVISTLTASIRHQDSGYVEIPETGSARWESYRPQPSWHEPLLPSSEFARFGVASFSLGGPEACVVNVTADVSDARIQRMVQAKRRQLPQDGINLLVVAMSGVAGSRHEWDSLVRRRFQPNLNRRFSAVVLLHEESEEHKLRLVASVIENPYARRNVPCSLLSKLVSAV